MRETNSEIILHGHSHKYSIDKKNQKLNVCIPSLSNINQPMPTALELNLTFDKGYIDIATIKQIYFGDQDLILNESTFNIHENNTISNGPILNIEPYKDYIDTEELFDDIKPDENKPSQVEKFTRRYGI